MIIQSCLMSVSVVISPPSVRIVARLMSVSVRPPSGLLPDVSFSPPSVRIVARLMLNKKKKVVSDVITYVIYSGSGHGMEPLFRYESLHFRIRIQKTHNHCGSSVYESESASSRIGPLLIVP